MNFHDVVCIFLGGGDIFILLVLVLVLGVVLGAIGVGAVVSVVVVSVVSYICNGIIGRQMVG